MTLQSILFHATVFLVVQLVINTTASQFSCQGTCYQGIFNSVLHVKKNKALVGHSYRNLSGKTDGECFGSCIHDCRCLSFQTQSSQCELLQEDRATAGSDFQAMPGYNYYDLKQEFVQQDVNNCINGCCRTNPCLNGGTCTELCSDVKYKFSCVCPLSYKGRVCETFSPPSSCLDIKTREPQAASGIYTVHGIGSSFKTHCDFSSEPNFVWTLIESFEFSRKADYMSRHFDNDFPKNAASPNWNDFRLAKASMRFVYNQGTTHFRATCNFEKDTFDINADYLRGNTSFLDILSATAVSSTCILYERVKVVGVGCDQCTAETWKGGSYHVHLEDNSCKLSQMFGSVPDPHREYFGYYNNTTIIHKCTMSAQATTQWWLGVKV